MQRIPTDKEDALYAWLSGILTGASVIWDKEDGVRPPLPFATMNIISGPSSAGPAEERYKSQDTYAYAMRKKFTLSINVHSDDALMRINSIVNALELPSHQSILQGAGIAVWGNSDPRDLSQLMDTEYEGRAQIDINLSFAQTIEDSPGEIRTVHVRGDIQGVVTENLIEVGE